MARPRSTGTAAATAAALLGAARAASIRPDPSVSYGAWEGWGVSLCWQANVFGPRQDLVDSLYTLGNVSVALNATPSAAVLPGLGLTIARFNAGGTAYAAVGGQTVQLSPNFPVWKQLPGYQPSPGVYDWAVDANQRGFALAAQRAVASTGGTPVFELFSNSPMWWMLANHNPSGSDDGTSDNLLPAHWADHAAYMAAVAAHYAGLGLPFDTVEPFNEPVAGWWKATGSQEGCHFDYSSQAEVLLLTRRALDAAGLTRTRIAASDESYTDMALAGWLSFNASVRAVIDRFNLHGYEGAAGNRSGVYAEVAVRGGKDIRLSEHGEGDDTGATLAANLALDMAQLHPRSWVLWQVLDSYNWGLLNSEVGNGTVAGPTTKWWVVAQYTRHVRPGDVVIDAGDAAAGTVAALSPGAATATFVVFNPSPNASLPLEVDLSRFASATGPVESWLTVASNAPGSPRYVYQGAAPLPGGGGPAPLLSATLPPLGVQTFVVHGVTAA
jgi:hypothetical protein